MKFTPNIIQNPDFWEVIYGNKKISWYKRILKYFYL